MSGTLFVPLTKLVIRQGEEGLGGLMVTKVSAHLGGANLLYHRSQDAERACLCT